MRTMIRRGPAAIALLAVFFCTACTSSEQPPRQQQEQPAPAASAESAQHTVASKPAKPRPQTANPADPPLARQQHRGPPKQTVKRVRTAAECVGLLNPREIGTATGMRASAAPAAGPGDCSFNLRGGGDGYSQVVLTEDQAGIGGTIRPTTIGGNTAKEQDESDGRARSCNYWVWMNDDRQLNTLQVSVLYFSSRKDACQAARTLASTAFHRLPNG